MATKVNVKFVIVLAAALAVLFGGVAVVAYHQLTTSGEEYEAKGDALMAEGVYDEAAEMYRRAVGHDRTNIVWLTKWRDALLEVVPETQVEYLKYYRDYYLGILNSLAALQDTDPAPQRAYLEPYYRQLKRAGANAESWQRLIDHVNNVLDRLPEDDVVTKQLHRYRGLARLARMEQVEERDAEREQTLADLRTALEVDPTDIESAVGILKWRFHEWKRAHRMRRAQTADQLWTALGEELIAFKEAFPDSHSILLTELQIAIERIAQLEDDPVKRIRMINSLIESDAAQPMLDALNRAAPETLDAQTLRSAYAILKWLRPREHGELLLPLLDRVIEAKPAAAGVMMLRADALSEIGRLEEAIDQYQAVSEMSNLPVSLDGLILIANLRYTAMYGLGDVTLRMRERTEDPAERERLLQEAKLYRDQLAETITEGSDAPAVVMLDGRIALAEQRSTDAVERFQTLNDRFGGDDAETLHLLGRSLLQANILGAARQQYESLVELNPGDVQSLYTLADIERRLHNYDKAIERFEQILALAPDFTEARMQINAIRADQGETVVTTGASADPIRVALIRWRALTRQDPPEMDEAIAVLREARRNHSDNPALLNAMIVHYNQTGDADEAMAVVDEAIALYPEDARFADWKRRLDLLAKGLSLDERLAMLDDAPGEPLEKLIQKFALLENAGRSEEAEAVFAEASRLAPDHPDIVEMRFMRALQAEDFALARSIASDAARLNLDSVNGLLYQARLEFAQEDDRKALATLERVIERLPYDPLALRLLGQTYLRLGRPNDAIDALGQAFQNKPDGRIVARLFVQALMQLQRFDEALRVVKQARKFNGADPMLMEQWLALEERVGDRELALAERMRRYNNNPNELLNAAALIRMRLDAEQWTEAREVIDAVLADAPENYDLARLDADWHALQGNVDQGVERLRAFTNDGDIIARPIRIAQYFAQYGRFDDAIETLEEARTLQEPGQKVVELLLADLYFRMNRFEEAVPYFREALAAGEDTDAGDVARRYADVLLRLGRFEEARQTLLSLEGTARNHARTHILLSRAAAGLGDDRAAINHLDAAVAASPNNPEPFIERASFNSERNQRLEDVLQDLNQAIRLAPTSAPARRLKASVLARHNRLAEASSELQEAVNANPDIRELRMLLIETLARMGQTGQAIVAATRAAQHFPDESGWLLTAGDLHARERRWNEALGFYARAYELDPSTQLAIRMAQAYLEAEPSQPQSVIDLLADHTDDDARLSTVLLLQSQAHARLDNNTVARRLATQSFEAANKPADIRDWFSGVAALFPSRDEMLDYIRGLVPPPDLEPVHIVQLARIEAQDRAMHDTVVVKLREIEPREMDPITRMGLYRLYGGILYMSERYEEAAVVFRKAVELAPNDLEFNNNLAYLMARHLDDAEGALIPAERAAQLAPSDPNVLDTLGWVYFQLGRLGQARATLNQALQNANTPAERIQALLHLAETTLAQNQPDARSRALRHAESARELIRRSPALEQQFSAQLEAVMEKLNQSE